MNQSTRKFIFLVVLTLCDSLFAVCQSVNSARDGMWNDPSTWIGGIIPTSVTASHAIIDHSVIIEDLNKVSIPRLTLNNSLTLGRRSVLNIVGDGDISTIDLRVSGTLTSLDSASIEGINSDNAHFENGSLYIHRQGPSGSIPLASWAAQSIFQISGFTNSGYINIAHSSTWKQRFGHVIYDCPQQTVFVVDLNGYLNDIAGNLTIRNTNGKTLRLSTTQRATINIGGDLTIEGPSELWFSTNAISCAINVQGDFNYIPASSGPSYLTTRGVVNLTVAGNLIINSTGSLRMCSSAADSSGTRQPTINVAGDLLMEKGSIIAPPAGNGLATIIFNGASRQHVSIAPPSSLVGNLHYVIKAGATLDMGTASLSSEAGSLTVNGNLAVGSIEPAGAIQLSDRGNILIPGPRTFEPGSSIEYNASSSQVIGNGHPSTGVDLVANNAEALTLGTDLANVGSVTVLRGKLVMGLHKMSINGDASFESDTEFNGVLHLSGSRHQTLNGSGLTFDRLLIDKAGGGVVDLISAASIRSDLEIVTTNTYVKSNGFLTLLSSGDAPDQTAYVKPIPEGSAVDGDVIIQRFMSGEGRIYRYLSCPVSDGSVEMLMDNFPVTGTFSNPSTGTNINSGAPSLFQYDESVGGLAAGWKGIPASGMASSYKLLPGKGYAAFIRNGDTPTIIDYVGTLNQGEIVMPVNFTSGPGDGHGWNLVGNPYASSIGWGGINANGWSKINVSEVISIRDNGGSGVYHYTDGDDGDIAGARIASGQSFWVRAIGEAPGLKVNEFAKGNAGAEFYRRRVESIPAFTLILQQDSLSDQAVFKVRHDASDSLDRWDGVKLSNDHINLAWMNHGLPDLAIQANQKFPCGEEIPISIKGLQAGKFSLTINARSGLETLNYFLIDHLYDSTFKMKDGHPLDILVVDDDRVAMQARFGIIGTTPSLQPLTSALEIMACRNQPSRLKISGTVHGLTYSIWKDHHQLTASIKCEATDKIEFNLHDSLDFADQKVFQVRVTSECGGRLIKNVAITFPAISVDGPDAVCDGQVATLSASVNGGNLKIKWFEDARCKILLSDSSTLVTAPLRKPMTYFVCGTASDGCISDLQSVTIEVKRLISPDEMQTGNFDMEAVNDSDSLALIDHAGLNIEQVFMPPAKGGYLYSPKYDACISADSLVLLKESHVKDNVISMYPNPVTESFTLRTKDTSISDVSILDSDGQRVSSQDFLSLPESNYVQRVNCSRLPDGVYLALIKLGGDVRCIRFVKSGNRQDAK
ncbi:MAG: T9SS type A sorting domain-containing protein [Chryseolinea sp.]